MTTETTTESTRFTPGQRVRITYGGEDRGVGTYVRFDAQCAWPHRVRMDNDHEEHVWTRHEVDTEPYVPAPFFPPPASPAEERATDPACVTCGQPKHEHHGGYFCYPETSSARKAIYQTPAALPAPREATTPEGAPPEGAEGLDAPCPFCSKPKNQHPFAKCWGVEPGPFEGEPAAYACTTVGCSAGDCPNCVHVATLTARVRALEGRYASLERNWNVQIDKLMRANEEKYALRTANTRLEEERDSQQRLAINAMLRRDEAEAWNEENAAQIVDWRAERVGLEATVARLEEERAARTRVHLDRHERLSEAVGLPAGYSADATVDKAISELARLTEARAAAEGDTARLNDFASLLDKHGSAEFTVYASETVMLSVDGRDHEGETVRDAMDAALTARRPTAAGGDEP